MTSGLVERIIPFQIKQEIEAFYQSARTGNITLNFSEGRIMNMNSASFVKSVGVFCSTCKLPKNGNQGWRVVKGQAFCPSCFGK